MAISVAVLMVTVATHTTTAESAAKEVHVGALVATRLDQLGQTQVVAYWPIIKNAERPRLQYIWFLRGTAWTLGAFTI